MLRRVFSALGLLLLGAGLLCHSANAQSLQDFEQKVTKFTLDNGLTFIVIKRPVAPVVSMVTYANVGSANEPQGHTGIAHIFEHMAFKGTPNIGTKNWEAEKPVLKKEDRAYQQWLAEKYSPQPDTARMNALWSRFKDLQKKEEQYVKNNEFSQVIERSGGQGLNAGTGADQTMFFYSLPENKLELWFSLESDRFKHPVFREFYKEKSVIREERRRRTESSPIGRLVEEFLAVAYTASPYQHPTIGWNSDITATTMEDARTFYETYYVPNNLTMAIAGDVDVKEVKKMAEEYFGDIPAAPAPPPVYTKEPKQRGEREFTIKGQSQPILLMGYHTVPEGHPDFQALQLLASVLSGGRTSILYKRMVENEETALQVAAFNGFPGTKYTPLFATLAVPNRDVGVDTLKSTILEEIENVKENGVTQEELDRARTNARADLIRGLDSNIGIARTLAQTDAQRGDWRKVFTDLEKLQNVTVDDLQRVAQKYLTEDNLTVGSIVTKSSKEVANAK
ncbi:MAG: pitrilysin family protein [Balneolaceae bacterium]|jgi:predicted Zn-dependent peptidase